MCKKYPNSEVHVVNCRAVSALTMFPYTQGAAVRYPGLCSSALTARAGHSIFLITYIQKIILIYWKVINTVSSLAYILSISLLSQHCEGLVFGSFHNLTFSRALVVDAAQVEYAVDNYSM